MSPSSGSRDGKHGKGLAQAGILAAVPMILLVAPMIGYFAGSWADKKLGTDPYLLIVGLALGFGAAAREIRNLIKKSQALDRKENNKSNGTGFH